MFGQTGLESTGRLIVGAMLALAWGGMAQAQMQAPVPAADPAPVPSSVSPEAAREQGKHSVFFDPKDGQLDLSEWLLTKKGFLPVPIIITEPAVGYGGGVAVAFFSQSMAEAAAQARNTGHVTPPDIYGGAIAATENGTKFGGGGAMLSFLDDRWRYRGGVGYTDVNLDFYGIGSRFGKDYKIGYNLKGLISSQQAMYRLGASSNFLALRWIYIDMDSTFDVNRLRPDLPEPSFASKSSGLGLSFEHDSRDTMFTPSRGALAAFDTMFYAPAFGSDETFQTYRGHVFAYTPVGSAVVLGGRLDGRLARGDVPFYQMPFIDMRGVPAARYQNDNIALAEVEARWNVTHRWGLIGFAGVGRAWGNGTSFDDAGNKFSKGAGFRYQIASVLKLWMGMDYAWGPDGEQAFYIQVGNAWR
ncbi:BamA/TamA family outer membrane protein [Uliginosibacterium sp. H1]|uniref:BamA/TamA family outer membrane protein n=1 Tax=Uliginosibacterium sp. H1 TaxID=3114757 RepID=UPI002E18F96A|nr:BamA/TamA family outer membrane protein [Uliginosibacterium sp. H1]